MKVNTFIGEAALYVGEREYILRPSFLSMSQIGDDESLIGYASWINMAMIKLKSAPETIGVLDMSTAIFIIQCCCDEDIPELGCIIGSDWSGKLFYKESDVCARDLIVIADHLVRYGINGVETQRSITAKRFGSKNKSNGEFKIAEFVASAIAHLKLSAKDAWQLTMAEFQLAIDSLYPDTDKKANLPTQKEVESTYQLVLAARARKAAAEKEKA